ncbi:SDR family oxidoreductase [Paraburkholderia dipogonis]|uniref:SDR family oxidoreductase n=1 Tax=Paraburkholderia dipogonis TaxID=1211383 RepID=A0A4Y8MK45_9BURK|nr:SDR family oxidoreductase [Paraburkholderia dipogonis]TFE37812.1 SDR family oxidoreductase [Paraburkholderia dipogonis]
MCVQSKDTTRFLRGKTVLITGAAQGIGLALTRHLNAAGANLVLVDIAKSALGEVTEEMRSQGGHVLAKHMDVANRDCVMDLAEEVEAHFPSVDVLVNNAAIGPERNNPAYLREKPKFWTTPDELWLSMLRINVFGPQLLSRVFVSQMFERGWGRIVNVTTSLDTMYRQGIGAYGPCKAALEAASRIMYQDLEGTGVTVNVLVPGGPVKTQMVPMDCGLNPSDLIQPEQMSSPLLWLCNNASDGYSGMRIVAREWDESLPLQRRLEQASAPIAWPQLGAQSRFPEGK